MEGMRSTRACILIGALLTLSDAAASIQRGVPRANPALPKKEHPVAVPPLSAPLPACETVVRIHQATLARSAPLDAAAVRNEFPELSPSASTLKSDACKRAAAELVRDLAQRAHHEAQDKGTAAAYELATDLYRAALRHAQGPHNARLRFGSAEVMFRLGELGTPERYCEAAPIYSDAIDTGAVRREDAAYAAVVAWDRCLEGATYRPADSERRAAYDEPAFAPLPISPPVQSLLAAMTAYMQIAAGSPPTPALVLIKYRRARILYEHNRITEAIPIFREITEKHPGSEVTVYAASLLLDCLAILYSYQEGPPEEKDARFEEISTTTERMLADPILTRDHEFVELLHNVQVSIGRKRVEQLEKAGHWSLAADGYMALATRFPQVSRRPELLYNAAALFDRARRTQDAITAREQLLKLHPDDRLAQRSQLPLARGYAAMTEYERAAALYEDFARRYPGERGKYPESSPELVSMLGLVTAIQYRAQLGQLDRALQGADQLIKTYGSRSSLQPRAAELLLGLGWIYEATDGSKHKEHLLQVRKMLGSAPRIDLQIVTAARLGELAFRSACPVATTQGLCLGAPMRTRAASSLARKPALLSEAAAYFSQALAAYGNGAAAAAVRDDPAGTREARIAMIERAIARVRLQKADLLFEEVLAPRTEKEREGKQREALALYQLVLGRPGADGTSRVTATARVAQLHLFAARRSCPLVPGSPCGSLSGVAPTTGVWAQAEQALQRCVEVAAEHTAPEWSGLCASELFLLRPAKHRLDTEVRVVPDHPSPLIDRAPVLGGND